MRKGNILDRQIANNLYQATLSLGDVFLGKFEGIDHEKFFMNDLNNIQTTLINSGLLTSKELELYFSMTKHESA